MVNKKKLCMCDMEGGGSNLFCVVKLKKLQDERAVDLILSLF